MFFFFKFAKFVGSLFFAEHYRVTASAVSMVEKGESANETVNYDIKTKAYVPI